MVGRDGSLGPVSGVAVPCHSAMPGLSAVGVAQHHYRAVACLVEPLWTGIDGSPIGIILV